MHIILVGVVLLLSGFASGLLGIGGGVVLVPAFYYVFKLSIYKSIGTSMALIAVTAVAGSIMHLRNNFVDAKMFFAGFAFVIAGSILGAYSLRYIPADIARKVFAVLLALVAVKMFFGGRAAG